VDGIFRVGRAIAGRSLIRLGFHLIIRYHRNIIGVITFVHPDNRPSAAYLYRGLGADDRASEIALAIKLRKEITGEWFLILMGLASIILRVAHVESCSGALALIWLIGSLPIVFGLLAIFFVSNAQPADTASSLISSLFIRLSCGGGDPVRRSMSEGDQEGLSVRA